MDKCTLRLWDLARGVRCLFTLEGHTDTIHCVVELDDGRVASGSGDNTIKVWEMRRGGDKLTLQGHEQPVTCVAELPGKRLLSGSEDCTVRVWTTARAASPSAANRRCILTLQGHERAVLCAAGLEDERVVSGSADKTVRVWSLRGGGSCVLLLEGHLAGVDRVMELESGKMVLFCFCSRSTCKHDCESKHNYAQGN